MSIPNEQVTRIVAAANVLKSQGYFVKVAEGDQRASMLFARLCAYTANPSGLSESFGALTKPSGGANVDGYAEDAVCYGSDPSDLMNVVDLVNGAGAPGASIGGGVKQRRPSDVWERPKPLSFMDMAYLLDRHEPLFAPPSAPSQPGQPYPSEDVPNGWWPSVFDVEAGKRYAKAGKPYPDGPGAFRWAARTAYDIRDGLTKEQSLDKHMKELDAELGL